MGCLPGWSFVGEHFPYLFMGQPCRLIIGAALEGFLLFTLLFGHEVLAFVSKDFSCGLWGFWKNRVYIIPHSLTNLDIHRVLIKPSLF